VATLIRVLGDFDLAEDAWEAFVGPAMAARGVPALALDATWLA
jgi:hypothetical protein